MFEMLAGTLLPGATGEPDLEGLRYIEEISGLDRARTDRIGDAEPWLRDTEPGAAVLEGLNGTSIPALAAALAAVSNEDLELARQRAMDLRHRWSVLGPVLSHIGGPNFAGLGALTKVFAEPLGPPLVALVAVSLTDEVAEFLDALPAGSDLLELEQGLSVLGELMAADPELARAISELGLQRAVENRP
jgi:hypothetical protein